MRADMTSKISITQRIVQKGPSGAPKEVYTPIFANIWASKEPILGNEFHTAIATNSKVEVKFRTYWFPGVENDMRVLCEGIQYEILSAINVKSLNRELLIYCKKVI